MKSSKRKICHALALAVSAMGASLAMASGPVVQGGGSSLVAPMIGSVSNPASEIGLLGTAKARSRTTRSTPERVNMHS